MGKILVLLTREFPFGKSEPFLETEIKYIKDFDLVYLCPLFKSSSDQQISRCNLYDSNIRIIDANVNLNTYNKLLGAIQSLLSSEFWKECVIALKKSSNKRHSLKDLISFSITGHIVARRAKEALQAVLQNDEEVIVYAYWLHQQAYVAAYLKKQLSCITKAISRCHRFDVYEYRNFGYIPYRDLLFRRLDKVFCISTDGLEYLRKNYPQYTEKFEVARLGTETCENKCKVYKGNVLKIVSCSNCVSVKRIELIIRALELLEDKQAHIEWVHYGDGPLLEQLMNEASTRLGKNVTCLFKGHVPNRQMLEEYAESGYHVFLNVSSSEGIPVSIMESMSFGIPAIATDVGGTSELVKDGINGFLLKPDFEIHELVDLINKFRLMSEEDYLELSLQAYNEWNNDYSAQRNYSAFSKMIAE